MKIPVEVTEVQFDLNQSMQFQIAELEFLTSFLCEKTAQLKKYKNFIIFLLFSLVFVSKTEGA